MALSRALAPNNPSVLPSHVTIVTIVTTVTLVVTLLLSPAAVAPHVGVGSAPHSLVTMLALAAGRGRGYSGRFRGVRGRGVLGRMGGGWGRAV